MPAAPLLLLLLSAALLQQDLLWPQKQSLLLLLLHCDVSRKAPVCRKLIQHVQALHCSGAPAAPALVLQFGHALLWQQLLLGRPLPRRALKWWELHQPRQLPDRFCAPAVLTLLQRRQRQRAPGSVLLALHRPAHLQTVLGHPLPRRVLK